LELGKMIFYADDWGFSPGINEGILELARNKLLYSVSCAANSLYLKEGLDELLTYSANGLRFQIHFNLSYGSAVASKVQLPNLVTREGNFYPLKSFIARCLLGKISRAEILVEFQSQMAILRKNQIPITGLDGHHHIHLLPFVYKSIEAVLVNNGIKHVRTMIDAQHMASYIQSAIFRKFVFKRCEEIAISDCGYLLSRNLINTKEMEKKINKFQRLLVHPAKYNDFIEAGMLDPLQDQRVYELNFIMEFFNE
jgi:predicted glycoside hydrolase/deacetylase ChbG (UPF0249 family)